MKYFSQLLIILCFSTGSIQGQSSVDSVKNTIGKMFFSMKSSDAKSLRECFADSAILQTIAKDKNGNTLIKNEQVADFIQVISTIPPNAADERITFDVVKVDANLAIAWTPYKFYLNGQFSHCGVNSFQLVRINNSWKIQYLIDTRRKQGCE